MYITVPVSGDISRDTALTFDTQSTKWIPANDTASLVCITIEDSYQDSEDSSWWANVVVSGRTAFLIADEDIPDQGGFLHIRNQGKAYVSNESMGCGTISPLHKQDSPRSLGTKIMVHIR